MQQAEMAANCSPDHRADLSSQGSSAFGRIPLAQYSPGSFVRLLTTILPLQFRHMAEAPLNSTFVFSFRHGLKYIADLPEQCFNLASLRPQASGKVRQIDAVTYFLESIVEDDQFVVSQFQHDMGIIAFKQLHRLPLRILSHVLSTGNISLQQQHTLMKIMAQRNEVQATERFHREIERAITS